MDRRQSVTQPEGRAGAIGMSIDEGSRGSPGSAGYGVRIETHADQLTNDSIEVAAPV